MFLVTLARVDAGAGAVAPATEAVAATARAAEANPLASLGINWYLLLMQFLNFALALVIIWFLILKPLLKKMEERQKLITEGLRQAQEAETALRMSQIKFQEKIDEAKAEANNLIAAGVAGAEQEKEKVKAAARQEIERLVNQAKRNIEIDRAAIRAELKQETAELVVAAVEKILDKKLDTQQDFHLIQETVAQLKK